MVHMLFSYSVIGYTTLRFREPVSDSWLRIACAAIQLQQCGTSATTHSPIREIVVLSFSVLRLNSLLVFSDHDRVSEKTSSSAEAINVFLRAADAHPMELRSATQRIHLRVSDILTGDDTDASTAGLVELFEMVIHRDSVDYVHGDFLDRATYMTFAGIYGLRGRGLDIPDTILGVCAAMVVNMNIYAVRHSFWVPHLEGLEQRSFTELATYREVLVPQMIASPIASLHPSNLSNKKASYARTIFSAESNQVGKHMPSMAKVRYHDDPAENRGMLRAWMQLRPLVQFLPPTFLSEKAAFLFPNNESGRAQTLRLMQIVSDNANLPPSPANALEECFTLRLMMQRVPLNMAGRRMSAI